MASFFIDRPVFAWVIALVIALAGALSITTLPVAQYPDIAPPSVSISATYAGASAKTIEDSVTQVIEQKMKGIDNLRYMASTSDSAGNARITLTFNAGTNPDIAQVQVQNKLQLAEPLLPTAVRQQGVTVTKASSSFLLIAGFVSRTGKLGQADLSDFVAAHVQDPIARVDGVGDVQLFGAQYAMRIWLDPARLQQYALEPADVTSALQAQNTQVSAGSVGAAPALAGQQVQATVTAQSRLQTPGQFRRILLKTNSDGSEVRLADVARVEIGSESYDSVSRFNGKPATGLAVKLATGANALKTANAVKARLAQLELPADVEVVYPYDTTPFVKISIEEVIKTLAEAIVLVFLVMYLFLQNLRATLIPTIAVPVVLLGTFGVLAALGFSINTLTMFGMVLAIGLLVDDAIVVVENVERVMTEEGLSPREATRRSMPQITGALVGIALVLAAVFVPMAFFGGSTGVIYRQFSVTMVSAMALSVLVALVLTPALCATLLRAPAPHAGGHGGGDGAGGGFFGWFNRAFARGAAGYQDGVRRVLTRPRRWLAVFAVLGAVMVAALLHLPASFLPDEDQGIIMTSVQLPAGATQARSVAALEQVERYYLQHEAGAVESVFGVAGFSFAGSGENVAMAFVKLKDWSARGAGQGAAEVAARANRAFAGLRDARVFAMMPPAVQGLGNASGFDLELQDSGGLGHDKLVAARDALLAAAAKEPALAGVRANGLDDTPQVQLSVDFAKAGALGVAVADVNDVLSTAWGGAYVNDFLHEGRVKKVYLQGEPSSRMQPADIAQWYVRNSSGAMVPFSAFATAAWTYGAPRLERYNGLSSIEIVGSAAPGYASGDAMAALERLVKQLPAGIGAEWTGLSYEERLSGSQAPALYAVSVLVVFLCLAALYESWSIPFSVMLVVPLGVLGALLAATLRGLSNDVYFQVGLLTTIGLTAKNAILIVEFAKARHEAGEALLPATLAAARMRLRPILMTSLAFILGVVPLAVSHGAGSASQHAIGTGVIGGMAAATVLGIVYAPLFYTLVAGWLGRRRERAATAQAAARIGS
ncbi:multidrug efflux RND transporter permease [Cupriavidus sp. USMAHM13]|uniref:efflux RND transporter permease subunit n=1 Tax=Cupriavidus sp. USMAHM13 TaxID=1389192 RepID=UPI0008A6D83B|nr:efflux RND transporter permease subunit [Cupriavidus sp. USMAHM13]AOZ02522.1 multidrug efflux RND transporter permease [Cupriavidus sp. USMAHM13]